VIPTSELHLAGALAGLLLASPLAVLLVAWECARREVE